jgi:hypothetical protein
MGISSAQGVPGGNAGGIGTIQAATGMFRPSERSLHVAALSAFAVAQPVYDRAAERAGYLKEQGVQAAEIITFVAVVSLLIPLALITVEFGLQRISVRAAGLYAAVVNYVLSTAILLPWLKRVTFLPGIVILAMGLAGGVVAAWIYYRSVLARQVTAVAAAGVLLFPAWFLLLSPAGAIVLPSSESRIRAQNVVPVVVVVFDEICGESLMDESRQIDADRFPGFAELSRHSSWFRNATTVRPMTDHAVPALLSGMFREGSVRPNVGEYPQNLFTLLRNTEQFELIAFEPISRLCTLNKRQDRPGSDSFRGRISGVLSPLALAYTYHLYPYDEPQALPRLPRSWFGLAESPGPERSVRRGVLHYGWGDNRLEQFEHFLECMDANDPPGLYFCHLMLPHVPWCYLPSGRRYADDGPDWGLLELDTYDGISTDWPNDELYVVHHQARYLLQLQFADRLVERLLDRLRRIGLFDRCLLVVVGDHGVSFRTAEPRRWLSRGNLPDVMPIPLFIKTPGQNESAVSDRNVESVDVLPTIAEVLQLPLPRSVDGSSVFDDAIPERPFKTINDTGARFTVDARPAWQGAASKLQLARFGTGAALPNSLFETGPHPELIGRPAHELTNGDDAGSEIEWLNPRDVYTPDRNALVPCFFEGRIRGAGALPVELAVVVNGTIRTVTRTYQAGQSHITWSALVPETCLVPGKNDIEFYVVSPSETGLSLRKPAVRRVDSSRASAREP